MWGRSTSVLVTAFLTTAAVDGAAQHSVDRLHDAVKAIVDAAPGEMGVAIKHLESGQQTSVHGDVSFPMASTFKVAVMVELFNQVDQGNISLDDMVALSASDLHLGSGQLRDFLVPGIELSVDNLVLLMMRISDNSATDKVMELVGIENIRRRLDALHVDGLSVDRTCQHLILDWLGVRRENTAGMSYAEIEDMLSAYEPEPGELEAAEAAFEQDMRDTSTPHAMNRLLELIFTGKAASEDSCRRMVDIMLQCDTGQNRIRGFLPDSVQVAHKTGTIGGTVNNVGIVYLPDGRGHVVIAVLSKGMGDREDAERAIADVARYAYDYFLFTTP